MVVILVAAGFWFSSQSSTYKGGTAQADASATPTATPTEPPPATTIPTSTPTIPAVLPEMAPVEPGQTVTTDDGIAVTVTSMEAVDGKAIAPGDVSGPAIRYTVEIANDSSADLDLGFTAVNAYIGDARTPALGLTEPGGSPFAGIVGPGAEATGVYIFTVPLAERANVTLIVDYRAGSPAVVFTGAVPTS